MRPRGHDAPGLEDDDEVGAPGYRNAPGHQKHRRFTENVSKVGQHAFFRGRIQRGKGVVEKHKRCPPNEGAGNGQTLPLAAGKVAPARLDQSVQSSRTFSDELPGTRRLEGGRERVVGDVVSFGESVEEVVPHRPAEEVGPLRDVGDPPPMRPKRNLPDVHAVPKDTPQEIRIEPEEEAKERRLPRTRPADHSDKRPRRNPHAKIFELEALRAAGHPPFCGIRTFLGSAEEFVQPLRRDEGAREEEKEHPEREERPEEKDGVLDEGDGRTYRETSPLYESGTYE